jgi:hypothetical protein
VVTDDSGARTTNPEFVADENALQYFQLQFAADPPDPDGDVVYFRGSPPPEGLAGKMFLDSTSGKVTFAEEVPVDDYLVYFWSEDEHGASTIDDPLKVIFSFRTVNAPPVVIYPADPIVGIPQIGGTLTVQYTFSDPDGDAQNVAATAYSWLRYDSASAPTGTLIPGATAPSYTTTNADSGKWLRAQVTPVDARGAVGASALSNPVHVYTRIVIDTFYPAGGGLSDTYLVLIDAAGTVLAQNDNGNPLQSVHDGYSRIDMAAGLPAGTYYVRITNDTGTGSPYYGIRVANYDPDSSFPILPLVSENDGGADDVVNAAGVPTNAMAIAFGDAGARSRAIFPIVTDVDWMVFQVP